jgi:hypothetical protein
LREDGLILYPGSFLSCAGSSNVVVVQSQTFPRAWVAVLVISLLCRSECRVGVVSFEYLLTSAVEIILWCCVWLRSSIFVSLVDFSLLLAMSSLIDFGLIFL